LCFKRNFCGGGGVLVSVEIAIVVIMLFVDKLFFISFLGFYFVEVHLGDSFLLLLHLFGCCSRAMILPPTKSAVVSDDVGVADLEDVSDFVRIY
jgi:hypothetical protein